MLRTGSPNGDEGADDDDDACQMEPDAGPCEAIKPRFFFDPESRTCLKFQGQDSVLSRVATKEQIMMNIKLREIGPLVARAN